MSGESAANTASINQRGHLGGIGMQLPVTMRGQDLQAATARAGHAVQARGQDLQADTARAGHAVQARGQDIQADTSLTNAQLQAYTQMANNEASNASAERRTGATVEAHKYAADKQAKAAGARGYQTNFGYIFPELELAYREGGKTPDGKPILPGMYPINKFEAPPPK
jgi:hypothetical protein